MREIKFRAIELNGNRRLGFVFGYLVDIATSNDRNRGWRIVTTFPTAITYTPIDITTVGQYTGLKDCNGKEIYEGDICCSRYYDTEISISTVEFIDGAFILFFLYEKEQFRELDHAFIKNCELKVIGNIYENPELIKEKKNNL